MVLGQIKNHRILKTYSFFFSGVVLIAFFWSLNSCNSKNNTSSDLLKGQSFFHKSNLDSAQFYFYKILESDSNNAVAINQLAEIHFRKVEIGKSLMFFNRAISIDSTNEETFFKIAEIKLFLGDYKGVFKNINRGLRINERKPEAYFMKGVAYKHVGDTNKAISSFKTAIELKHNFAKVYYELGLLLTLQNDPLAIEYYKRGIEVSPKDAGLKYSLAWSYNEFNNLGEADKAYNNVVREFPSYVEAKSNYAVFKYNLNQADTALLLCNQILDDDSLNCSILNLKGTILKEKGRLNELQKIRNKLRFINSQLDF
tara:strand:+ start:39 stop:977 length:939 start_codon:yes stop_codon:yes gene_type:complete